MSKQMEKNTRIDTMCQMALAAVFITAWRIHAGRFRSHAKAKLTLQLSNNSGNCKLQTKATVPTGKEKKCRGG